MEKKADNPKHIRLKLLGIGGAGGNIVNRLAGIEQPYRRLLSGIEVAAINTDARALAATAVAEKIQIGAAVTHGLSAGGDVELGMRAAQADAERLAAAVQNVDVVILAAGLGGGTGTGACPVVARLAREQGALVLAFVALPFAFEGERRRQQALVGLEQLKQQADAVICVPNDKLFKLVGEQARVEDAFQRSDQIVISGVQSVWQLLARKGLINLDFGDLRATLGAKHGEGLFSYGEGQGADKAKTAVQALMDNPLFDGGEVLAKADGVLVSLLGGPDLTLAEVQKAVEPISHRASRAHLILGAAIDEEYRGRLSVMVIAATRRSAPAASNRVAATPRPVPAAATTEPAAATEPGGKPAKAKPRQETLPLDQIPRGQFVNSEPTLHNGENLDVPTFMRRGISLRV